MKVKKKLLQDSLQAVMPGLGKAAFVDTANLVTFFNDRIWTFNGDVGASAPMPSSVKGLNGTVDGTKLYQFVSKAPADVIAFEWDEDKGTVKITSSKARITLPWTSVDAIPHAIPSKWTPISEEFLDALAQCALCCSTHLTRPWMTGVYATAEQVFGTDGNRGMAYKLTKPLEDSSLSFLLPRACIGTVVRSKPKYICNTDTSVWFQGEAGSFVFCAKMSYDYADKQLLKQVVPSKAAKEFTMPFHDLDPVLDRAKMFSAEDAIEGEQFVDVESKDKQLFVQSQSDISFYEEWIPLTDEAPDFSISLAARHLLDLVGTEKEVKCALDSAAGKLWLTTEKWKYISVIREKRKA